MNTIPTSLGDICSVVSSNSAITLAIAAIATNQLILKSPHAQISSHKATHNNNNIMNTSIVSKNNHTNTSFAKKKKTASVRKSDPSLKAQIKSITGTDHELNALTSKQLESLLLSYGMEQSEIDTLDREDRIRSFQNLSKQRTTDSIAKAGGGFMASRKDVRKKRRQTKRNNARKESQMADRRANNKAKRDAEQALLPCVRRNVRSFQHHSCRLIESMFKSSSRHEVIVPL